jgi:hypothetical protein
MDGSDALRIYRSDFLFFFVVLVATGNAGSF